MPRLLLASLLVNASALAADFSGNWSGTGIAKKEPQSFYFIFRQDGTTLKGSAGPDVYQQRPIEDGKIDGQKISFDISPGYKAILHFELFADGSGLKGTFVLKNDHETVAGKVSVKKEK
jgi:hypothetical protein